MTEDDPTPQWQHDNEEGVAHSFDERFERIFGVTEAEMNRRINHAVVAIAAKLPPESLCTCESMGGRFGAHRDECPWQQAFKEMVQREASCPSTKFPDGTHCGEYGWHASDCPARTEES